MSDLLSWKSSYLGHMPSNGRAGLCGRFHFSYWIDLLTDVCPRWLYQFAIWPIVNKSSSFHVSSPACVVGYFVGPCHSDWCETSF